MARDQLLEHRLGPGLQREHGGPVQVIVVPDDLAQVDTQERGNLVVAGDPAEVGSQAVPGLLDGARATPYGPGCPVQAAQLVEDATPDAGCGITCDRQAARALEGPTGLAEDRKDVGEG